jgi:hypothetical protein
MYLRSLKNSASSRSKPSKTLSHAQLTYGTSFAASLANPLKGNDMIAQFGEIRLVADDAKSVFLQFEFGLKELEVRAIHHDTNVEKFFPFDVWYYPNYGVFK